MRFGNGSFTQLDAFYGYATNCIMFHCFLTLLSSSSLDNILANLCSGSLSIKAYATVKLLSLRYSKLLLFCWNGLTSLWNLQESLVLGSYPWDSPLIIEDKLTAFYSVALNKRKLGQTPNSHAGGHPLCPDNYLIL